MKHAAIIFLTGLILLSCSRIEQFVGTASQATQTLPEAVAPNTPPPSTSPTPKPTSLASPTETPRLLVTMATLEPLDNRDVLRSIIDSPSWEKLGLSLVKMEVWQAYADGKKELGGSEKQELENFLAQWEALDKLVSKFTHPFAFPSPMWTSTSLLLSCLLIIKSYFSRPIGFIRTR